MSAQLFTVDADGCGHGRTGDFQPQLLAAVQGGPVQISGIITGAPVIVILAVGAIDGVPGMGQIHRLPAFQILGKCPSVH